MTMSIFILGGVGESASLLVVVLRWVLWFIASKCSFVSYSLQEGPFGLWGIANLVRKI